MREPYLCTVYKVVNTEYLMMISEATSNTFWKVICALVLLIYIPLTVWGFRISMSLMDNYHLMNE